MLRLSASLVMPASLLQKQQQHAQSARQVRMTMTLTQQRRATVQHVLLAVTALLARHHVLLASPDKPIWMGVPRLHVRLAETARTRLRQPQSAHHVLQARLTLTCSQQLLATGREAGSYRPR